MKKILLSILLVSSIVANAQFWTEKATGFNTPARSLYSISIVDANVIWALACDSTTDPVDLTIKEFTRSIDGGETWTPGTINLGLSTNELGVASITAVSSTTAWVSAYPDTFGTTQVGGIWKTIDGGLTWNKQTTALYNNSVSYANFVHFWNANNGIAQGDPENGEFEIYTTIDGGTTWNRVPAANIPDPNPDINGEYGYENFYSISGNTIWFGTDRGRIFKSVDKGLNWTAHLSPSANFELDKFSFSTTSKGLLSIYGLPILLFNTTDGGETWNPLTTTGVLNTDISYIPGTSKVIATDWKNPLGSSYSIDDGVNWIYIDGVPHGISVFLNDTFGLSAGFNTNATTGGIFKFTGIPLKVPSFDLKTQFTVYPNPTNGIVHLNSENSIIKEAMLFDLLGRQVYNPKFSALNKVDLDLNSLQNGTYLLKVSSDSGKTETIKIMKN